MEWFSRGALPLSPRDAGAPRSQVCSYRCIVSHESPRFEAFSLSVLQKHNCLKNSAERPRLPEVRAMAGFRGQPLTHELAEEIFIGWMRPTAEQASAAASDPAALEWSWKVVCGVNPGAPTPPGLPQSTGHRQNSCTFWLLTYWGVHVPLYTSQLLYYHINLSVSLWEPICS
jgi:hypothetical protein